MADKISHKPRPWGRFGEWCSGFARAWAVVGALVLSADASGQAPPKTVQDRDEEAREKDLLDQLGRALAIDERFDALVKVFVADTDSGHTHVLYWGNVHGSYVWKGELVRVWADRILILWNENAEDRKDSASFYAEGSVRIETSGATLQADAFFHDHQRERGVAIKARGRGGLDEITRIGKLFEDSDLTFLGPARQGPDLAPTMSEIDAADTYSRWRVERGEGTVPRAEIPDRARRRSAIQMTYRADVLRLTDLLHFDGEGVTLSTCEYGEPHWALSFEGIRVTQVVEPSSEVSPEGEDAAGVMFEDARGRGTRRCKSARRVVFPQRFTGEQSARIGEFQAASCACENSIHRQTAIAS